jgi:hypothetical protein
MDDFAARHDARDIAKPALEDLDINPERTPAFPSCTGLKSISVC